MEDHFKYSDDEFEALFENCALDPAFFNHEAHIRLAWIHLSKYNSNVAETNIQTQLKHFVSSLGAMDKYNDTLTIAAVKIVHHFMTRSHSTDFKGFIKEFPELIMNFKGLIAAHYGFDIYGSSVAKKAYIEPDLIPFVD